MGMVRQPGDSMCGRGVMSEGLNIVEEKFDMLVFIGGGRCAAACITGEPSNDGVEGMRSFVYLFFPNGVR